MTKSTLEKLRDITSASVNVLEFITTKVARRCSLSELEADFKKLSNLTEEAMQEIKIARGEVIPGEHQNIAPAERRPGIQ